MVNAYSTSATSTTLIDTASNRTIYANNENEIRSVASISKIMTAILAIESNKLNDDVIIKDYVSKAYGSGIYIEIGEEISLKEGNNMKRTQNFVNNKPRFLIFKKMKNKNLNKKKESKYFFTCQKFSRHKIKY